MRALIRDLAAQGMTVLLSSHLLVEVEEVCNRVAIIRRGRVAYQGSLAELRRQAGVSYRLRTSGRRARPTRVPGSARDRGRPGLARDGGLVFGAAGERAVGELTLALAESGALVLELSPRQATLEDLFFRLTEDSAASAGEEPTRGQNRGAGVTPAC